MGNIFISECQNCRKRTITVRCKKCNKNYCLDCFCGKDFKVGSLICAKCKQKEKEEKKYV